MKAIQLATIAWFTVGIVTAQATPRPATTTHYSAFNVSLVVTVDAGKTSGQTCKFTSTKARLANKEILKLLADAHGTAWPAGAKLEYDWDSGQVIVADKTGTNILFYAGTGIERDDVRAWLAVEWVSGQGPVDGSHSYNYPGADSLTFHNEGRMALFYADSSQQIDLVATGENTRRLTQKWDTYGNYTTWADSESCVAFGAGLTYMSVGDVSVKGTIKASGSGLGLMPGGYNAVAPPPPPPPGWTYGGTVLTQRPPPNISVQ